MGNEPEDKTRKNLKLEEFIQMLDRHNWFYVRSDDNEVYRKGFLEDQRLISLSRFLDGEFLKAYKEKESQVFGYKTDKGNL